ncbi:hypothetical protein HPP92_025127 [Vanilla planifolia]|uniref:Protein kinase domain-containing protein n=1 Tax=Vanilla planifolia TaxID=51239 RepID=A0A835PJH8_VANPL|nr:hypothetical protein HPP92_025127 [Vanilla planifolia]
MHFPAFLNDYYEVSKRVELYYKLTIAMVIVIEIVQIIAVLTVLVRFVFAPSILCIFLAHKFWRNWASTDAVEKFLQAHQSLTPTRYAYSEIIAITRHFKEQLGKGGFGSVYKGEVAIGNFVAVKMLGSNSKCNGDEFISEVSTIGRIRHVNVVRLVGYCSERSKRAVIYEYMQNGSLDKHIFSSDGTPKHCFTWQKLKEIAIGVARGIHYLHHGCDMTILHFDIKPQNILLDENFTPKVSDFGLAKLYPKEHNVVSVSAARGTIGYIAPELVSRNFGTISDKSDVYSFGMLLIEMAAGRRNVNNPNAGTSSQIYYPSLIYDKLKHESEEMNINYSFELEEEERKLYLIGLWCIQVRPSDRPSMQQVVQLLERDADFLQLPPNPSVYSSSSIGTTIHSRYTSNTELPNIEEDE